MKIIIIKRRERERENIQEQVAARQLDFDLNILQTI